MKDNHSNVISNPSEEEPVLIKPELSAESLFKRGFHEEFMQLVNSSWLMTVKSCLDICVLVSEMLILVFHIYFLRRAFIF